MRNTCAVTYNILFLPKNQLVMRNRATYHGDCKSPYSAPADCKSAGTEEPVSFVWNTLKPKSIS